MWRLYGLEILPTVERFIPRRQQTRNGTGALNSPEVNILLRHDSDLSTCFRCLFVAVLNKYNTQQIPFILHIYCHVLNDDRWVSEW